MEIDSTQDATNGRMPTVEAGQPVDDDEDLDHIFDDMDEDETSAPAHNPWRPVHAPLDVHNVNLSDYGGDNSLKLKLFYRHFFPMKQYIDWLNYDTVSDSKLSASDIKLSKTFMNREFCFTLMDDTYIRFQSYKTVDEFRQELTRLNPAKIDLGAIYNIRPRDKASVHASAFKPMSKELVFDVDMTDYDDIRTCCSGGDVCMKCWEFMTVAMKIVDSALKDDFGFKNLLWVYSGRRGVHCWVGDERARQLNNEQRKAIVAYLDVTKGGERQGKTVKLPNNLHPSVRRSYEIIDEHFKNIVFNSQDILRDPTHWEKILTLIPDETVQQTARVEWEADPDREPSDKWEDLRGFVRKAIATPSKRNLLEHVLRDIMFQYTYPRLDEKVSTNINHLLKSPFCVHPKTGRVCVPIEIENCEKFDPTEAPTTETLINELNQYDTDHPGSNLQDWEKTSLASYVKVFEAFVKGNVKSIRSTKQAKAEPTLEF
ncbi:DNA primase small subunit [Entomortierella parvispora]|uniref:DNA primase n=1 Tax=Entomortierella parvispora TaxID=205924 RepID=A0A9P3LYR7_9FUNG|nr:DNA primase small subunit [Entomortierella parvispora]